MELLSEDFLIQPLNDDFLVLLPVVQVGWNTEFLDVVFAKEVFLQEGIRFSLLGGEVLGEEVELLEDGLYEFADIGSQAHIFEIAPDIIAGPLRNNDDELVLDHVGDGGLQLVPPHIYGGVELGRVDGFLVFEGGVPIGDHSN